MKIWLKVKSFFRTLYRAIRMGCIFYGPEDKKATRLVSISLESGLKGIIRNQPHRHFITLLFNDESVVNFWDAGFGFYAFTSYGEHGTKNSNYKWSTRRLSVDLMWDLNCAIKKIDADAKTT